MIHFNCSNCGRAFSVDEQYTGRKAKCRSCGVELIVPEKSAELKPLTVPQALNKPEMHNTPAPRMSMRTRRLMADAEQLARTFAGCDFIRVSAVPDSGDPPEAYQVEFRLKSLEKYPASPPRVREWHRVEIRLGAEYPRLAPQCRMLTPVFHPNIDADGATICIGDHWAAGERLADLVVRVAEMLAYQAYNIKSPLNAEAAMWADLHQSELPTDARNLHPGVGA